MRVTHPGTLVLQLYPLPDVKHGNFHMYATLQPPPPPRIGSTLVNARGWGRLRGGIHMKISVLAIWRGYGCNYQGSRMWIGLK